MIPEGWVPLPNRWSGCEVYVAPDLAHVKVGSPWVDCGAGCLELQDDWSAAPEFRMFGALGASSGDVAYLGYHRYLDAARPLEVVVVRLPDNTVTFDAIVVNALEDYACESRLLSVGREGHLLQTYQAREDGGTADYAIHTVGVDGSLPLQSYTAQAAHIASEGAAGKTLWAASFGALAFDWHPNGATGDLTHAWQSDDGSSAFGLVAAADDIFFSTWLPDLRSDIFVWDTAQGPRPFVSFPSKAEGGACCLTTDGSTLAWLQGEGYQGGEVFSKVSWMTAPFTTDPTVLTPAVLHTAYQNSLVGGGGTMGGGYLLHAEHRLGESKMLVILTRLSDGAHWTIAEPPGFYWVRPVYVTKDEIALELAPRPDNPDVQVSVLSSWSVRRISIASLGEPSPKDAGF